MEHTNGDVRITRLIQRGAQDMDRHLPRWARRSNPIIRRQLGRHWRTILPETGFLKRMFIIQAVLVALTVPLPFLFDLTLPVMMASLLLFPVAVCVYAYILLNICRSAVSAVADELQNKTFDVIRATSISLREILSSKVSGAIWRHVEDLGLLLLAATLMSMPLLVSQYAQLWPLDEFPLLSRAAMVLGLAVSLGRLMLEPVMVASVAALAGATLRARSAGVITTAFLTGFYFLLLNLLRLIPMAWPLRFAVEFILPILLPLLTIAGAFWATEYVLTRE